MTCLPRSRLMRDPTMRDQLPLRFIILGSARSGSNLLLSLLGAHPSVKTYGELFNLDSLRHSDLLEALDDHL